MRVITLGLLDIVRKEPSREQGNSPCPKMGRDDSSQLQHGSRIKTEAVASSGNAAATGGTSQPPPTGLAGLPTPSTRATSSAAGAAPLAAAAAAAAAGAATTRRVVRQLPRIQIAAAESQGHQQGDLVSAIHLYCVCSNFSLKNKCVSVFHYCLAVTSHRVYQHKLSSLMPTLLANRVM
jgi:hypothetical protein